MDAPHDRDVELQKESGDLIKELKTKLPPLLWKPRVGENDQPHRWAKSVKVDKLIDLLDPFQEWPQLLDPHLQGVLSQLTAAFLAYLEKYRDLYTSLHGQDSEDTAVYPLPRAICKLLYVLCKIRGEKVIIRFLQNDPKYLEPLLRAFVEWDGVVSKNPVKSAETGEGAPMVWEERYTLLLWISHLLLAPFDLSSISSDDIPVPYENYTGVPDFPSNLPRVALSLISIALQYIVSPGKEAEAATSVLARLALRLDMQRLGLLDSLVSWSLGILHPQSEPKNSVFEYIGVLSFVAEVSSTGRAEDLAPYVMTIFEHALELSPDEPHISITIKSSASARKLIIKILRNMTTLSVSAEYRSMRAISGDQVSRILEDAINHFLVALADNYTPVRLAASKALSVVTLRLDSDPASDVIDAVIGALDENILYEKLDGSLISRSEGEDLDSSLRKRNISAVDPQKWHGLILTLAHLLFRRSPPIHQLLQVLESLVSGMGFEQRLPAGASIGGPVRDASCFGIWSLARKYTTGELSQLDTQGVKISPQQGEKSILQTIAVELVCAACLDSSGNIRRGASAALQELVGRHPDTVQEGISLVQIVDYHAVARRSRAMAEVAQHAARLSPIYWAPLIDGLLQWRGIGSPDSDSRRSAASAIGTLSVNDSYKGTCTVLDRLLEKWASLPPNDAESRHGCLLSLAATVDAFLTHKAESAEENFDIRDAENAGLRVANTWQIFDSLSNESFTVPELRPHLAAEAVSRLLSSLARSCVSGDTDGIGIGVPRPSVGQLHVAIEILKLCVSRGGDIPIKASSRAASDLFVLLPDEEQSDVIRTWIDNIQQNWKLLTGQGKIAALGAVFRRVPVGGDQRQFIIEQLVRCTGEEEKIAKRVSAVRCLALDVLPQIDDIAPVASKLVQFLDDYTTDRRGDIGSLIRIEAINGVNAILEGASRLSHGQPYVEDLMQCVARLAAEKLDNVRIQAWKCLRTFWESNAVFPPLKMSFDHFSEVSSTDYFLQLLELLSVDFFRPSLIKGLITSASAGTEGLVRSSRFALVEFINTECQGGQRNLQFTVLNDLIKLLDHNIENDRYAIPAVETLAFLLDAGNVGYSLEMQPDYKKLFVLTQRFHLKSSNLYRIEAAIRLYAALRRVEEIRTSVTKKMAGMLLHPYPKIRVAVAESLFMETGSGELRSENWTMPPSHLKPTVEKLRGMLISAS